MATTQKKTTAKKPAPKKAASGKQRVKTPPYNHALRLTVGVVFLLLAVVPGVQLTLPGIAGIILGIGMAVDANVVIFEPVSYTHLTLPTILLV